MAYVRARTTAAGVPSTALVEAYRDAQGRPRQRLLANLHGEPTLLKAMAKVAALRRALRKEKEGLAADAVNADRFYEAVTQGTLHGKRWSAAERKEIDQLMLQRARLLKRLARIERDLDAIQKYGVAIKKHCTATSDEVQAAIKAYEKERHDAECRALGLAAGASAAKAAFRRLST